MSTSLTPTNRTEGNPYACGRNHEKIAAKSNRKSVTTVAKNIIQEGHNTNNNSGTRPKTPPKHYVPVQSSQKNRQIQVQEKKPLLEAYTLQQQQPQLEPQREQQLSKNAESSKQVIFTFDPTPFNEATTPQQPQQQQQPQLQQVSPLSKSTENTQLANFNFDPPNKERSRSDAAIIKRLSDDKKVNNETLKGIENIAKEIVQTCLNAQTAHNRSQEMVSHYPKCVETLSNLGNKIIQLSTKPVDKRKEKLEEQAKATTKKSKDDYIDTEIKEIKKRMERLLENAKKATNPEEQKKIIDEYFYLIERSSTVYRPFKRKVKKLESLLTKRVLPDVEMKTIKMISPYLNVDSDYILKNKVLPAQQIRDQRRNHLAQLNSGWQSILSDSEALFKIIYGWTSQNIGIEVKQHLFKQIAKLDNVLSEDSSEEIEKRISMLEEQQKELTDLHNEAQKKKKSKDRSGFKIEELISIFRDFEKQFKGQVTMAFTFSEPFVKFSLGLAKSFNNNIADAEKETIIDKLTTTTDKHPWYHLQPAVQQRRQELLDRLKESWEKTKTAFNNVDYYLMRYQAAINLDKGIFAYDSSFSYKYLSNVPYLGYNPSIGNNVGPQYTMSPWSDYWPYKEEAQKQWLFNDTTNTSEREEKAN